MASNSQNAASPPSDHPPPDGAQFRAYLETIDFNDDFDVEEMFARPRPVPGYGIYPAPPTDDLRVSRKMRTLGSTLLHEFAHASLLVTSPLAYNVEGV